jgi:hypothetical protein
MSSVMNVLMGNEVKFSGKSHTKGSARAEKSERQIGDMKHSN